MKKIKRLLGTAVLTAATMVSLTGCGTEKITPEQSGKMYYDLCTKHDVSIVKDVLGDSVSEEEYKKMIDDEISDVKDSAINMFKSSGEEIPGLDFEELLDEIIKAMSRAECKKVTVLKENEDEVELEFETTYININSIPAEFQDELQEKYMQKAYNGDYGEDLAGFEEDFMKEYVDTFMNRLKEYKPTETKTFKYTFVKESYSDGFLSKKEVWSPKGEAKFGMTVSDSVIVAE